MKWFSKQSRLVQLLLLVIPFVNWITELVVRWDTWSKKGGLLRLVICIFTVFGGMIFGWIDFVWVLLFKKLIYHWVLILFVEKITIVILR